ncbi:MAG: response regulator [Magnetococcus sp. DMHC-1]
MRDKQMILVADDDPDMRLLYDKHLHDMGYTVVLMSDGVDALALFDLHRPDLVILDADMPQMDGFSACIALRKRLGEETLPILVVTALADDASVDRAFAAGANDYITKPIHWGVLRHRLYLVLQNLKDKTVRKLVEDNLERLVSILEATHDFVGIAHAADTSVIYMNPFGREMVGIGDHDDVTRFKIADFHPEWANRLLCNEIIPEAIHNGIWMGECAFLDRNECEIPVHMVFLAHKGQNGQVDRFSTISRNIAKQKLTENELCKAKELAENANQAKTNFLATMSHEIRTPMNGVLGMADLLRRTFLTEQQRHYVETIHRSGRTLLRVINDILDLSKIHAGQMLLELIQFDLIEIIHDINDLFVVSSQKNGIGYEFLVGADVPTHLLGDPYRLSQILFNLLGNAFKFTEAGSVKMLVDVDEESAFDVLLRFQIIDTGIGITPNYKEHLFDTFSQENSSISRRFGGSGMGLAITRNLVGMMQGTLGVNSIPGQGSTFWFTVRFGKLQAGDRRDILAWQNAQVKPMPGHIRFQGHVLLVEDDLVNQEVAVANLELFGCQVTVVNNGQKAIAAVHAQTPPFDAIFMDCEVPVLDGLETTMRLRQMEKQSEGQHTPIIAMTAHVLEENKQKCKDAGMDDYLRKPFSQANLGTILSHWLPQTINHATTRNIPSHPGLNQDLSPDFSSPTPPSDHSESQAPFHEFPVFDQETLDRILELSRKSGNGLLNKIVNNYLTQTSELLIEMERALEQKNHERVRIAAHTLKSSSLTMGMTRMVTLGRIMETNHANLTLVQEHFLHGNSIFSEAKQALNNLIASQHGLTHP